jgi:hypothetical protein
MAQLFPTGLLTNLDTGCERRKCLMVYIEPEEYQKHNISKNGIYFSLDIADENRKLVC